MTGLRYCVIILNDNDQWYDDDPSIDIEIGSSEIIIRVVIDRKAIGMTQYWQPVYCYYWLRDVIIVDDLAIDDIDDDPVFRGRVLLLLWMTVIVWWRYYWYWYYYDTGIDIIYSIDCIEAWLMMIDLLYCDLVIDYYGIVDLLTTVLITVRWWR